MWHDILKVGYPKKDNIYLNYTTKGYLLGYYEQGGSEGEFRFDGESYSDFTEYPSEDTLMENEVIAWCEIPKFRG